MSRAPLQWWVRAGSRAYGPYASERLPAFVREGRLTPETSVANDPSGPWWPAGRNPSLEELFATPALAPVPAPPPPAAEPPGSVRDQLAGTPPAAAERPAPNGAQVPASAPSRPAVGAQALLVFAELLDGREAPFALALGALGAAVRARPGLWLLRAASDAAAVRNALSQALGEGESLVVVRAEAADAAWFNLGGEADRALRALWLQPAGRSPRA